MSGTPAAEPMQASPASEGQEALDAGTVMRTSWERGLAGLEQAGTFWVATVSSDGRPHAVPVLAVVVDGAVHFCASERSKKARNLARDPRCVITASSDGLDLVVEGEAVDVDEEEALRRVANAYASKYGWQPEVRDGGLWADGAPTAGPPPYRVRKVVAEQAFGLPTDNSVVPTRWRF